MIFVDRKSVFILQIIAVFLAMLNLSDIKVNYLADFLPLFDVMIIYYFAVLRPGIFAIWFLFVLGIISDSISGVPLGITSFCYIIAVKLFVAINNRATIQQNFYQIFGQFIAFTFVILLLKWLIISVYSLKFYNIINPLIHLTITSITYIFMHMFFHSLDKKLLESD